MFSARTRWDRTPNRLALAMERAKIEQRTILDLTESNPTRVELFDTVPLVAELGHPRGALYEPNPRGHAAARNAVAGYYTSRGLPADPERIVLSASTSEAYSWIFGLLADAGDVILTPRPGYPLFGWIGTMAGVALRPYQLARDAEFRIDLDDLRRKIDAKTRAIVVVHPNNPTGTFARKDEAAALCRLAKEHDLALIVDEVFGDSVIAPLPDDALASFAAIPPDVAPLTFVLSGLSKIALLPQCKLGWTLVTGPSALADEALARLEFIADTFLSVATPVQLALPSILQKRPLIATAVCERLRQNLATLDVALAQLGPTAPLRRLPVWGGWYVTLEVPRFHDEDAWIELLLNEDGVLVQPGYFFDFDRDGFLVLSLLTAAETFADGVRRLVKRIGTA